MSSNPYESPVLPPGAGAPINNWLIPAIASTVCCCVPFGIVSIVNAAQVNVKLAFGDYAGAKESADKAKFWFFIALGSHLAVWVIYILFVFLAAILGAGSAAINNN